MSTDQLNLTGANLRDADLTDARLHNAILKNVSFKGAILSNTDLRGARLEGAKITDEQIRSAKLGKVAVSRCPRGGIDFTSQDLSDRDLTGAHLEMVSFEECIMGGTLLRGAYLRKSCFDRIRRGNKRKSYLLARMKARQSDDLKGKAALRLLSPDFEGACLEGASFQFSCLIDATLREASLSDANLEYANLSRSDARNTSFAGANLRGADFTGADLRGSNLSGAVLDETKFVDCDLRGCSGLEKCVFIGPCPVDSRTIARSSGSIPSEFLKNSGFADWEIEATRLHERSLRSSQISEIVYDIDRSRSQRPIQIHNLFISYSREDDEFVEYITGQLEERGIRYWRDIYDAPSGPLEEILVRAIRSNPTVLLILSRASMNSDWVEFEIEEARRIEKELERPVLCPIAVDDTWKGGGWSRRLLRQVLKYNVLDFSEWKTDSSFNSTFLRLLEGLDLFYKRK